MKISQVSPTKIAKVILLLLALIISILFCSCISQKKIDRICSSCPTKIERHDSIFERIIVKDTTVYITQPGAVITIDSPCDSLGMLRKWEFSKKKNGIVTHVKSDGKVITADCETDSLQVVIKNLIKERNTYKSDSETKIIDSCSREHRTSFDSFCRWWFLISVISVLLFIAVLYLKSKFK